MSEVPPVLTWLPVLGSLALKSLILFLVAGAALLALRRASASARHLVCLLALVGLLALPLLSLALPGWRLAVLAPPAAPPAPAVPSVVTVPVLVPTETGAPTKVVPFVPPSARLAPLLALPTPAPAPRPFPWLIALAALWLGGVLIAVLRPLLGLWGIARLSQASAAVTDASILAQAAECASALGISQAPALRQADASVPMTWGWHRPVVLLPAEARDWPEGRLRAVLLHELAHVRRRDWLSHRLADVVCALYWFHPLAWLTARRLKMESEIACDDLVLTSGVAAPDYARHLLDVARALRPAPALVPTAAIAMARTARIEGRLTMILDTTRPRRALTRRALLTVLSLSAAALVPLAVLRLEARAQAAPGVIPARHLTTLHVTTATPTMVAAGVMPIQLARVYTDLWELHGLSRRRVQFAFRLPAAARDVTVKYALTGSLYSSSDGTWPSKMQGTSGQTEAQLNAQTGGARIVTATFPSSVSKTNVRVSTASGHWEKEAAAAPTRYTGSSVTTSRGTFIFSPVTPEKGNIWGVTITTGQPKEDVRIVAIDARGHELLPSTIGDTTAGGLDQITARFAGLPLPQIKEFRVESRPFHSVEFKNVALRPAK